MKTITSFIILFFVAVVISAENIYLNSDSLEKTSYVSNCTSFKNYNPNANGLDANSSRSKQEIIIVVNKYLIQFRKLIQEYPKVNGKMNVSIGVNNCGSVDTCFIVSSEIKDTSFDQNVISIIRKWQFNKIDREDDYLLFTFPFIFGQK